MPVLSLVYELNWIFLEIKKKHEFRQSQTEMLMFYTAIQATSLTGHL